jgi:nucleotide-binding universal stress UspA family protein
MRLDASHPDRAAAGQDVVERFEKELKPLVAELADVAFRSEPGDPAMSVCRQARKAGADLIILGCHQHGHKLSLGRVDYVGITILEKAHCPVMLVPFADNDSEAAC